MVASEGTINKVFHEKWDYKEMEVLLLSLGQMMIIPMKQRNYLYLFLSKNS